MIKVEFYSDHYKVIAHIADFPSAGYYLVCLRSGESLDIKFKTPEEAIKGAENPRLCNCIGCVKFYLEEDFGLTDK